MTLRFLLIASFLVSFSNALEPMVAGKSVEMKPGFLGTQFLQDGKPVNPMSMFDVLSDYPEAKTDASSSKFWSYSGTGLGAVGGFLVGYTGVQPLVGGEFNAPLFFTGAGVVALALVCGKIADNKLVRAVEAYNHAEGKVGFKLDASPSGMGLTLAMRF